MMHDENPPAPPPFSDKVSAERDPWSLPNAQNKIRMGAESLARPFGAD